MRRQGCLRWLLWGGLIAVVLAIVVAAASYFLITPYQGYHDEVFVEVAHGTSTRALATQLEQAGVIRSRYSLLILRATHPRAALQAGEYHFDEPLSAGEVFDKIRRGDIFFEDLTVPEGSNIYDIANLLKNLRSVKADGFLAAAADPQMVRDLDPQAPDLEGFLFPATYRLTRKTDGVALCRLMTAQFRKTWRTLTQNMSNVDVHRTVTLASLVEKETAVGEERPLVAAVFSNRLQANMPLQCDPTVAYSALRLNRYRGTIYKSDLASSDPYNTYAHPGLPPGPIANPGAASLTAALHPAETNYFYFVAKPDGSGRHRFSATLAEHSLAVKDYRKGH